MGYFLGIDVGAARTVAAVARSGTDAVEIVDLGDGDGDGVASVLHLGEDGALTVGDAAQERARTEPDRVVAGFPARIGDGDPLLLAGEPWAAEELTAWLVRWVVDRVAEREDGPAAAVAVAHTAAGDPERMQLLAEAVAEQDLDARFTDATDVPGGAAAAAAAALRGATAPAAAAAAADVEPGAVTSSGRHAVVGDEIAALAAPPAARAPVAPSDGEAPTDEGLSPDPDAWPVDEDPDERPATPDTDDGGQSGGATDTDPDGPGPEPDGWGVPAPRSSEPATAHLVADLAGFTGGMGATNTAGLLSGYTPPHGTPSAWSAARVAVAADSTSSDALELPDQRAGSGRWGAVGPAAVDAADDLDDTAPPAAEPLRAHQNPTVLVGAGGLVAALAVVGTLLLWPAPRITDSASSRPLAAVPAAAVEPTVEPTVSLTPTAEPIPTHRARPVAPRTRRPAVPPVTAAVTETTPPPTESAEPTESATTAPPTTTEKTDPPTTEKKDDD